MTKRLHGKLCCYIFKVFIRLLRAFKLAFNFKQQLKKILIWCDLCHYMTFCPTGLSNFVQKVQMF